MTLKFNNDKKDIKLSEKKRYKNLLDTIKNPIFLVVPQFGYKFQAFTENDGKTFNLKVNDIEFLSLPYKCDPSDQDNCERNIDASV